MERLARIEELEREHAPSDRLLDELRELVREAEAWARVEPERERVAGAVERCRSALAVGDQEDVMLPA
jgi:uncharacterized coiled-coil protein SlyX